MQPDRTYQIIAHHGIVFDVSEFIVQPNDYCRLRTLSLPSVHNKHYQVIEKAVELYERMQAGTLPCHLKLAVSRPLTRQQGDVLNNQRDNVSNIIGSLVGKAAAGALSGPIGLVAGALAGGGVGMITTGKAKAALPTFHANDVLVSLMARVTGDIGPQSSSVMLIL
ncbi:hypothetical protein JET64_21670 [Pseudomonas putida]|nr:hypothetical protein [Pseudomonas putida]